MGRLGLLGVMAVVGIAMGGCGDSQPSAPLVAEPETVGKMAETTAGGGDRGWTVTRVAHNTNGHWITVEKEPDADCGTRAKRRRAPCAKWTLKILDETVVLRGQEEDARPASPSDVEEGQTVHAIPSASAEFESYPPTSGADKIVILGTR